MSRSLTGFRKKRTPLLFIGLIIFLLATAGLIYWFLTSQNTRQINSIAVMPFVNESGNVDIDYLSDGMTETLISYLSQLPDLDVKARSSVFRYKDRQVNAQTIGKELNVQAILTGRLVQRGRNLTLYTELVDAKKETVLWSQDYNQPIAGLVSLQREINRDVVQKLKKKLSGSDEQKLTKSYTANSEAYQLYLKGRYYWNRRTAKDVDKSIEYYQQAIGLDTNYALAYAGLADSYTVPIGGTPSQEKMQKGRDAARVPIPWSGSAPPYGFGTNADTWLPMPSDWADVTAGASASAANSSANSARSTRSTITSIGSFSLTTSRGGGCSTWIPTSVQFVTGTAI
jgi:TolB-like protein